MGTFSRAYGRITVEPEMTEERLLMFWIFNNKSWPDSYKRKGEWFASPWFFDENNKLTSRSCKFCEDHVWFEYMKEHFFNFFGYKLVGDPEFDYANPYETEIEYEYENWKNRLEKFADAYYGLSLKRTRCCPYITCDEEIEERHEAGHLCSPLEDYKYCVKARD